MTRLKPADCSVASMPSTIAASPQLPTAYALTMSAVGPFGPGAVESGGPEDVRDRSGGAGAGMGREVEALPTSSISTPSVVVSGLRVFAFDSVDSLIAATTHRSTALVALNAEKLVDPPEDLQRLVNANIGYADGSGAVLAMRRKGVRAPRLAGSDLWLDIVRHFAGTRRFYLVGGADDVIGATVRRLQREFPTIQIVGYRNGYLAPADVEVLADDLRSQAAEIVFVAMGSPRQERLIEHLLQKHPALYMGLGGSFDVYVGRVRRAPILLQNLGLEWLYRLAQAPRARLPRQKARLRFALRLLTGRL